MQRFLLDANVLIPLEPTSPSELEADAPIAAEVVRRASELGFHLLVHPETIRELATDRDPARRVTRRVLLSKYEELTDPPGLEDVESVLGAVPRQSNNWVDHLLLAALHADAVHYLVTNDEGIHRKARRLKISADRVLTIADARALLDTLVNHPQTPPPQVRTRALHSLRRSDPIFESLRGDYPDFDRWFQRKRQEGREAWTIEARDGRYAGICIWKPEDDEHQLGGKVMKISTFKVADEHRGHRYGELLLKTAFNELHANHYDHVWLTAFERHAALITMLEEFGFERLPDQTELGELVLAKRLTLLGGESADPFEYHRRYGPPAVDLSMEGGVYVIPIRPRYHRRLFPDHPLEPPTLFPLSDEPFGNALRKAYLSQSQIAPLPRGATILFYRSMDQQAVTAVGVVEDTMRSDDATGIAEFAGQRTVYSYNEIEELARQEVLTILFRQDRLLDKPWPLDDLIGARILNAAPQSITQIHDKEAIEWINRQLAASR